VGHSHLDETCNAIHICSRSSIQIMKTEDPAPSGDLNDSQTKKEAGGVDEEIKIPDAALSLPDAPVKRNRLQRSKTSELDRHIINGVPEVTLIQNASKTSPLCNQTLQLMGKVFPRAMENMFTSTVLGSGDQHSHRTVVLLQKEQVVCALSCRWIQTHKFMEYTLCATDPGHRKMGFGRVIQAWVTLLSKRCGCDVIILHAEHQAVGFWERCNFMPLQDSAVRYRCSQVMSRGMKNTIPYGRDIEHIPDEMLQAELDDAHAIMLCKIEEKLNAPAEGEGTRTGGELEGGASRRSAKTKSVATSKALDDNHEGVRPSSQRWHLSRQKSSRARKTRDVRDVEVPEPAKRRKTARRAGAEVEIITEVLSSDNDEQRSRSNSTSTIRDDGTDDMIPGREDPETASCIPPDVEFETDLLSFGCFWEQAPASLAALMPIEITVKRLWAAMELEASEQHERQNVTSTMKTLAVLHLAKAQQFMSSLTSLEDDDEDEGAVF